MEHVKEEPGCGDFGPSELGTREYWDKTYVDGIKHFKDSGVIDEGWFGEDSSLRVVKWLCTDKRVRRCDKVVDIGCGNGVFLLELAREGFTDLTGLDYSSNAIELAKAIALQRNASVNFGMCDILSNAVQLETFDIALDKGTYDAISLHYDNARDKRVQYIKNVWTLLKSSGLFVITSCNWTEKELVAHFSSRFAVHHIIPTPTFKFGGNTGNLVTTVIFQKRDKISED